VLLAEEEAYSKALEESVVQAAVVQALEDREILQM
jgi:hypothetical protein